MQIRITPEQMESVAKEFKSNADQSSQIVSRLNTTMDNLMQNWEGVTQKAYYSEFQNQKVVMNKFIELLNIINDDLTKIAAGFRMADNQQ